MIDEKNMETETSGETEERLRFLKEKLSENLEKLQDAENRVKELDQKLEKKKWNWWFR